MKFKNSMIVVLLTTFGASAAPLTGDALKRHVKIVCGMRDTLDLKVPFDNHVPTEPLNGINRGVVHAAKDAAAKKDSTVLSENLSDCQTHVESQYNSNPKLYGKD